MLAEVDIGQEELQLFHVADDPAGILETKSNPSGLPAVKIVVSTIRRRAIPGRRCCHQRSEAADRGDTQTLTEQRCPGSLDICASVFRVTSTSEQLRVLLDDTAFRALELLAN